jgi:hypothetical protein
VLHRTANSPFSATQQLQQLQQQLRANNFSLNAPASAPILNSASAQNLLMQLTSSVSASSTNLLNANNLNLTNANLMMMNSNNNIMNNLAQFNSNNANMLQHQLSNQSGVGVSSAGKMWSNFGSTKDNSKKYLIF